MSSVELVIIFFFFFSKFEFSRFYLRMHSSCSSRLPDKCNARSRDDSEHIGRTLATVLSSPSLNSTVNKEENENNGLTRGFPLAGKESRQRRGDERRDPTRRVVVAPRERCKHGSG